MNDSTRRWGGGGGGEENGTHLVAAVVPRVKVGAEVDLQTTVAQVLDADLQVEREIVQVEAEAVRLHQVPVERPTAGRAGTEN